MRYKYPYPLLAHTVVSIPGFTAPNGKDGPGKTLPPLNDVPGTVPSVPINRFTYCVRLNDLLETRA